MQKGFNEPGEKPRRFYKAVEVMAEDAGYAVRLDARNVRTPKGGRLVLPTRALAEQVAEEWASQDQHIDLATMHANRLANTALEAVRDAREATAEQVASFAGSDLLCYFAEQPAALVQRQEERWGPLLERAERELGLRFVRAAGIVHRSQPAETIAEVKALALALDDFALAGLAFGTALFGSAVLALGLQRGWLTWAEAFEISRTDEAFQEEKWGVDAEAAERTERLRGEAQVLERWFRAIASA
jgi:chaperone required for assembly of F1-ATPase